MSDETLNISSRLRSTGERRCTLVGVVTDAVMSIVKIATGIVAGSAAMVADGVHSISDFIIDTVVYAMVGVSGRGVDEHYRYGHGKFGTLATFLIALILLGVGVGLFTDGASQVWHAMHGAVLARPSRVALIVAVIAITVKEGLYHYTRWHSRRLDSTTLLAYAWHHRGDALSSVGTLCGIAGAIYLGDGWQVLDPLTAMAVSILILVLAVRLGRPAVEELLEVSLPEREVTHIEQVIGGTEGVKAFHNLRTRRNGSVRVVDVHIKVDGDMNVTRSHAITTAIEQRLNDELGSVITYIHVEPYRGSSCCEEAHRHDHSSSHSHEQN